MPPSERNLENCLNLRRSKKWWNRERRKLFSWRIWSSMKNLLRKNKKRKIRRKFKWWGWGVKVRRVSVENDGEVIDFYTIYLISWAKKKMMKKKLQTSISKEKLQHSHCISSSLPSPPKQNKSSTNILNSPSFLKIISFLIQL